MTAIAPDCSPALVSGKPVKANVRGAAGGKVRRVSSDSLRLAPGRNGSGSGIVRRLCSIPAPIG